MTLTAVPSVARGQQTWSSSDCPIYAFNLLILLILGVGGISVIALDKRNVYTPFDCMTLFKNNVVISICPEGNFQLRGGDFENSTPLLQLCLNYRRRSFCNHIALIACTCTM